MFSPYRDRPYYAKGQPRLRSLGMEHLENRMLLSGTPPAVTAVNLGSTQWTSSFVGFLQSQGVGAGGYAVPAGSNQLKTLPWTDLNQVRITFDQDVHIAAGDLSVSGTNVTAYAFSDFSYDSATYTATWTLAASLAKDKILLDLDANGKYPVHNYDGQALDGAWTTGASVFPSGNGNGGDDFKFQVNVLPGDIDGNNCINNVDSTAVRFKNGKNAGDIGYNIRYDTDGNGSITLDDYILIYARMGNRLPLGSPAGITNSAPTVLPLGNLGVSTNAVDTVFSLGDIFGDAEDSTSNLTFSVTNNTNSSLFSAVFINQGVMTLSFAANTEGTAALTLRATDSGGLFVEMTFHVTVADTLIWIPDDNPPVISNFGGTEGPENFWTFAGTVTDPDQEVAGMIVTFGGVLEGYGYTAIVQADGTFTLTKEFPGIYSGTASAQTFDSLGMSSNLATYYITV
jgi:hypothetical protein